MLADVLENFINSTLNNYYLDPCYYYSLPGLSWDAVLRMTKIELDQIKNDEIHTFIERAKRGGICIVSKRYSEANNKNCPNYDPIKEFIEIRYFDILI